MSSFIWTLNGSSGGIQETSTGPATVRSLPLETRVDLSDQLSSNTYRECSEGQTVGETTSLTSLLTTGTTQGTSIFLNSDDGQFTISCCGQVQSWTFNAGNTGSVQLQIWRRDSSVGTWTLIGQNNVTVSTTGEQTHDIPSSERIAVLENDVIGWFHPDVEIIIYRGQASENRYYYESTNASTIGVGETYDWDSEIKQDNRRYVLYSTLGPGNSPTFENLPTYSSVSKDTASGTSLMQISTNDVDGDNVTVTMTTASTIFIFTSESGTVSTQDNLVEGFHTLEFQATDSCGNANTSTLTVFVYKENYFAIVENQPVGTSVGQLIQPDSGSVTAIYAITGSVTDFTVDTSTGLLSTLVELDYETMPLHTLQVEIVLSPPTFTATMNVTITVLNLNEYDPWFDHSTVSGSIIESASIGTSVMQISAFDIDTNMTCICNYTILEPSNQNASAYFDLDLETGILTVKAGLDRETINYFEFEVEAIEGGSPVRNSTGNISVTIWDYNDNNPNMSSSFYDGAAGYGDICNDAIVTISATDDDIWRNARMSYYLVQSDDSYLFQMNETTGELSSAGSLTKTKYTVEGKARDNGVIELHANGSSTIRIDTFNPSDVILSFYMEISRQTYLDNEDDFLRGLESDVFSSIYPSAQARRWCIQEINTNSVIVHVYILESDITSSESNIGEEKVFINNTLAHRFVGTDEIGTLSAKITGNSWSVFNLQKVLKYTAETVSVDTVTTSSPWIQTTEGIAVVSACAAFGFLTIVIITSCIIRRCCKKSPKMTEPDKVTEKRLPTGKTVRPVPFPLIDVPPPYYRGDNHRTLKPMPYHRSLFSKPKTMRNSAFDDLSSTPIGIPRETPESVLPSVENSEKSAVEDWRDGSYIFKNRKFDGRVYEKGQIMQYNTKDNTRDWIRTPEGNPF